LKYWPKSNGATKEIREAKRCGIRIVQEYELIAALDEKLKKENANA